MGEVLRISSAVATPLGLLGLIAALGYYFYSRHLKHEEKRLEALPPEERAQLADQRLSRYGINATNLTREDKNRLILEEMDKRYRLARLYALLFVVAFVICFGLASGAFIYAMRTEKPVRSENERSPTQGQFSLTDEESKRISELIDTRFSPLEKDKLFRDFDYQGSRQDTAAFLAHCVQNKQLIAALDRVLEKVDASLPQGHGNKRFFRDEDKAYNSTLLPDGSLDLAGPSTDRVMVVVVFQTTGERFNVQLPFDLRCELAAQRIIASIFLRDIDPKRRSAFIAPGADFSIRKGEKLFQFETLREAGITKGDTLNVVTEVPYPWVHDSRMADMIMKGYVRSVREAPSLVLEMIIRSKLERRLADHGVGMNGPIFWDLSTYEHFLKRFSEEDK